MKYHTSFCCITVLSRFKSVMKTVVQSCPKKLVPCYLVKTKSQMSIFQIKLLTCIFCLVKTDMSLSRHLISYFVIHIPTHLKLTNAHLSELQSEYSTISLSELYIQGENKTKLLSSAGNL